jgi:predicted Zn-dependent protease
VHIGYIKQAIEILNLNTQLYPSSGNAYDSLAEAYERSGNKLMALKNYRRSLEYSPDNTNTKEQIRLLDKQIKNR